LESYLKRIRPEYKLRRDLVLQAIEKYFPEGVKYVKPRGGFYIWIELPAGTSAQKVLDYALDNGVVFVLGKSFVPDDSLTSAFRIAYSNVDIEQIDKGIRIIGEGIKRALE
jgi:2-aminoadipate transaminase